MTEKQAEPLSGAIVDESVEITIEQLTAYCAVDRTQIHALVAEGILVPHDRNQSELRFGGHVMGRAARALRLQRELDVNAHAVAVIIDLLDQIEMLQGRLRRSTTDS